VNKARMIERMAELVRDKKIEGISDLRDESDRQGVRVVVEVKKDAVPDVVLNQLYSFTPLQTSFGVNMLALDNGRPELMNLKHVITSFVRFREEVITRRTNFLLGKARDRAHVLVGLAIAVANIDEVIAVIKKSADPNVAREELMKRGWPANDVMSLLQLVDDSGNRVEGGKIRFTEAQARAILELRLQRLTGLERNKIDEEMQQLAAEIADYLSILGNREKLYGILRSELLAAKEQFATPRRTVIELSEFEADIEDLIQKEDMVVTVTSNGYIKRTALSTYRAQRRGGKGRSGMDVREEDITTELLVVNTHTPVLFFSNKGQVYKLKVYRLPIGAANTRGKALVNIFPLSEGETITTFMPLPEDESKWDAMHIFFATAKGNVRRNDLSDFHDIRTNGKIAIRLEEGDRLIGVRTCSESDHVLLASKAGKCIRFQVSDVRVFKSRTSDGVRGMKLAGKDEVVSMSVLSGIATTAEERYSFLKMAAAKRRAEGGEIEETSASDEGNIQEITLTPERFAELEAAEQYILTVTENGYGKRSSAYEYRTTGRGGSGIVNIITSARNGQVVASQPVNHTGQIMLMTDRATVLRCPLDGIRIAGRNTQGVTILKTGEGEKVVSVVTVPEGEAGMNGDSEHLDDPIDTVAPIAQENG
jgi:DNA gyrase subunit A